ncbi:uncharacterized protein [Periplaneta americana]
MSGSRMQLAPTWHMDHRRVMFLWAAVCILAMWVPQSDCVICSSDFPYDTNLSMTCSQSDDIEEEGDSCKFNFTLHEDVSHPGKVILQFSVLPRSCNVSEYKFVLIEEERVDSVTCNSTKNSESKKRQEERVVRVDESAPQACGRMRNVTFWNVQEGCYFIEYRVINNTNIMRVDTSRYYLYTNYTRRDVPCSPYNKIITDQRYPPRITVMNSSLLYMFQVTVTAADTCNEDTSGPKVIWIVKHNTTGHLVCDMNDKISNSSVSCRERYPNTECEIHDLPNGNYCCYVVVDSHYCYCPGGRCSWKTNPFAVTLTESPPIQLHGTSKILIIILGVLLSLLGVCFAILLKILWNRRTVPTPDINRPTHALIKRSSVGIFLLYSRDCPLFMELMVTFRKVLQEMTKCKVYDCFDPDLKEEMERNKLEWVRRHVAMANMKVVVVESACAMLHQQSVQQYSKIIYTDPTCWDELFLYGLKAVTDDLRINTYNNVFVIRIDGFTEANDVVTNLTPRTRYLVPQLLGKLLMDLSQQRNLSFVPCLEGENFQKFQQDLNNLVEYKKQNPFYLNKIISRCNVNMNGVAVN